MLLPSRSRTAWGGLAIALLVALLATPAMADEGPAQRQELDAALRQVDALERFVAQSAANVPSLPGGRYYFDYPRLLADLARVRAGIEDHLTPSRAQPRDPDALGGQYSSESKPDTDLEPRP